MHDAVQENFLLLNLTKEFFVDQKGIARRLKQFLLLVEGLGKIADNDKTLALEQIGGGFQRNFASGRIAFRPITRINGSGGFGSPELFGVEEKVFQERRSIPNANCFLAGGEIAPHRPAPGRPGADEPEFSLAEKFEQGEALGGEEGFKNRCGRKLFIQSRLRKL